MKPILLKITSGPSISFNARSDSTSYKNNNWHYHPEYELAHVVKGTGTLFAGDGMHYFKPGDLVFIGSYLPNYRKFDPPFTAENPADSYIELTQFRSDFWGRVSCRCQKIIKSRPYWKKVKRAWCFIILSLLFTAKHI